MVFCINLLLDINNNDLNNYRVRALKKTQGEKMSVIFFNRKTLKAKHILAGALMLLLLSCSSDKVAVKNFTGNIEASEGEEVTIEWNFENAKFVDIVDYRNQLSPSGVFKLKLNKSKEILFKAYNDKDTLDQVCKISISNEVHQIQKGPSLFESKTIGVSEQVSDYLGGIKDYSKQTEPTNIRICRQTIDRDKKLYILRALVFDKYGNFIKGLSLPENKIRFDAEHKCSEIPQKLLSLEAKEYNNEDKALDMGICIDISAASSGQEIIKERIKEFLPYLKNNDKLMLSVFNQEYKGLMNLSSSEYTYHQLDSLNMAEPLGLNALYKASYLALGKLNVNENNNKALVVVTYNADNSSLIYTASDVAKAALKQNIPIYIIGVGDAVESYSLRYLCSMTGGKYYEIEKDELSKIKNILTEIAFAQRNYYEFQIDLPENCNDEVVKTTLLLESEDAKISDFSYLVPSPKMQYIKTQSIVSFDYHEKEINPMYGETIVTLARLLKDNATVPVELVGHSSQEGTEQENIEYSLERAQSVKSALIACGASTEQIRVKGVGSALPVYYLESAPWQNQFNRRVDLHWLDSTVLPYEITAARALSEEEATEISSVWEKRGYRVYFERWIEKGLPVYKVKLWGFATLAEAEKSAKELIKKYKKKFIIE